MMKKPNCTIPPYRLLTSDDVLQFAAQNDSSPWAESTLAFSQKHVIPRPEIFHRLPEVIPINLKTTRTKTYRHVVEHDFALRPEEIINLVSEIRNNLLTISASLPDNFTDMAAEVVTKGRALLDDLGKSKKIRQRSSLDSPHYNRIIKTSYLNDLFGELLFYYLNNKNLTLGKFFRDSLLATLFYDNRHLLRLSLIGELQNCDVTSHRLFSCLENLINTNLLPRKKMIFYPFMQKLLNSVQARIMVIRPQKNEELESSPRILNRLKSNVFGILNTLNGIEEKTDCRLFRARQNLKILFKSFEKKVDAKSLKKIQSLCNHFIGKFDEYDVFFRDVFWIDRLNQARREISQLHDFPLRETREEQIVMVNTKNFSLYPTKDYGDLIKRGEVSGDCTTGDLGEEQLLCPRFFNIRIFRREEKKNNKETWIGNIYCLDYTDKKGTIIIDRIQFAKAGRFLPFDFFESMMEGLNKYLLPEEKIRVIAPPLISNTPVLIKSFKMFCKEKKKTAFTIKEKGKFESAKYKKFFVLLDRQQNEMVAGSTA